MFSGIVETSSLVLQGETTSNGDVLRIQVARPKFFDDIKNGDSICANGVCLTVEAFNDQIIQFALGKETLKITGWTLEKLKGQVLNLERSLKLGGRIHGHFVTGHVDGVGRVRNVNGTPEFTEIEIEFPPTLKNYFWKKGSVGLNGVSLTVNDVQDDALSVGLIPETLKITNLKNLKVGDPVNLEVDFMSRAFINYFREGIPQ